MVIDILGISLFVWLMMYTRNSLEYMSVCSITSGMEILQLICIDCSLAFESWILQRIISSFLSFFLLCQLWTNHAKLFILLHSIWKDDFIILFYFRCLRSWWCRLKSRVLRRFVSDFITLPWSLNSPTTRTILTPTDDSRLSCSLPLVQLLFCNQQNHFPLGAIE